MSARHPLTLALVALGVAVAGLGLAWVDVLPGGWRLRGWVTPHTVRAARAQAELRERRLLAFGAEAVPDGAVLFLGSSTIERWPLAASFPGRVCLNRGVGGESLPELIDRLERSLPAARPAAAVLYLGSIDVRERERDPARTAALARIVVEALRARWPGLPLTLVGLLPERETPPALRARLDATNAALVALCAAADCAFVDTHRPPLVDAAGNLPEAVAADRLHLNDEGYRALSGWLQGGARWGE